MRTVDQVLKSGGFVRIPERCDNGIYVYWGSDGRIAGSGGLEVEAHFRHGEAARWWNTIRARRYRKDRNDVEWLSMLRAHPGASRMGWRGVPMRCAHKGLTHFVDGTERLTERGEEWLDFWLRPF